MYMVNSMPTNNSQCNESRKPLLSPGLKRWVKFYKSGLGCKFGQLGTTHQVQNIYKNWGDCKKSRNSQLTSAPPFKNFAPLLCLHLGHMLHAPQPSDLPACELCSLNICAPFHQYVLLLGNVRQRRYNVRLWFNFPSVLKLCYYLFSCPNQIKSVLIGIVFIYCLEKGIYTWRMGTEIIP